MDISRSQMRYELGEIGRDHDRAMKLHAEAVDRALNENDLNDDQKGELFLGGLNRRKFMTIGGVSIASAAIFAACGSSSKTVATPTTTTPAATPTTAAAKGTASDITILRTAEPLEVLAVDTYKAAASSGLVTTAAVGAAAKDFMEQHEQHVAAFEGATTAAGGVAFTKMNPVVYSSVIEPALKAATNQTDVVALAYALETAAAATYVSTVGAFDNHAYNSAAAAIAGVESRHITVLASVLANAAKYPAYPAGGFFTTTAAVKPGTGV